MKKLIFCVVGNSGSGKTMLVNALEEYANIPMIRSYTDRPRRTPDEVGHTFLEKSDYDLLKESEMIARTCWNGVRYCCLASDVQAINTYVIDEVGLQMLKKNYSDIYRIIAIRIYRPESDRIKSVGEERVARDKGKFTMELEDFDYVAVNTSGCKLDLITDVWTFIRSEIEKHVGLAGCEEGLSYGTGYAERD